MRGRGRREGRIDEYVPGQKLPQTWEAPDQRGKNHGVYVIHFLEVISPDARPGIVVDRWIAGKPQPSNGGSNGR